MYYYSERTYKFIVTGIGRVFIKDIGEQIFMVVTYLLLI